jgi:hypothetical protein
LARGGGVDRAAGVLQDAGDVVGVEDGELRLQAQHRAVLPHQRTPSAWKVQISTSLASRPTSCLARSRISAAALLVKVMAAMRLASRPAWISRADLVRDHARLARAGAGQHQARPMQVVDGFLLGEVQAGGHREAGGDCGRGERERETGSKGDHTGGPRKRLRRGAGPRCRDNTPVLDILLVTFPFFALVLAGYVAARRRMLPLEAIGGLNTFVLFFALPCMLYRFGASTPVAQLLDPAALGTWLVCALLVVAVTVKSSMNARIRWNDASFGALVAAFSNTGFMGVPLLVALLGPRAAGPAILTILIDLVFTSRCASPCRAWTAPTNTARRRRRRRR